jgi:BirA family biotin operon repressor/biotin-[acetyl-CoA-carboxylase] ligase
MTLAQTVLSSLADGHFHSGEALARTSACSRSAIWKAVQALQQSGVEVFSVRGKGYRLATPLEMLNRESILTQMSVESRAVLQQLEVCWEVDSTNARLLERGKQAGVTAHACLAERQLTGRGRRGREWVSPFGGNLYLSLLWRFSDGAANLGGLSLAVAVAVIRALQDIGLTGMGVKWPNDILVGERKLAGILLELAGEASGPCVVVIGVGMNIRLPAAAMSQVNQPWTDLEREMGRGVPRNALAGMLLQRLIMAVQRYELEGLAPFLAEWREHDLYADRSVVLHLPQGRVHGIARGVDDTGALLLARDGALHRYHSGEVSVRLPGRKAGVGE